MAANQQQQASTKHPIYATFAGAGVSRHPNGIVFDTPAMMWWDQERIDATVDRQFVLSNLRPDEQVRLDEPLGFGDGLTDNTYMEWIEEKAKRIFLILVDIGVPDQIFGVIDDSWDDDDLPIPFDQVERLQLTYAKDEKLERKFFIRQFIYLLRNIQKGAQETYEDDEVVPLELAEKRPVGAVAGLTQSNFDKVHLPGRPDDVFVRRKIALGVTPGRMPQEEFLSSVAAMKVIKHTHVTSLWASYVHQGNGYLLLTPANDSSLKSFLNVTPQSFKILPKQDRRVLLLNWIHCLADAISFLHSKGLSHKSIKPSNVMLDSENQVFLSDTSIFPSTLHGEKSGFDKEMYDYSAPERLAASPTISRTTTTRRPTVRGNNPSFALAQSTSLAVTDTSSIYTSSSGSAPSISPVSKHDPQKADIFSLGTIFLEILTCFMKRASRNFASHRSSRNKTPGRGGGLPDSSFHLNPKQIESWMGILAKDAKKKEDKIFRGVTQILVLTEKMMTPNPEERPTAVDVQGRIWDILTNSCGLGPSSKSCGRVHCQAHATEEPEDWDFGFDELRLASQRAAAEACASVNAVLTPAASNGGTANSNGSGSDSVERAASVVSSLPWSTSPNSPIISSFPRRGSAVTKDGDRMSISSGNKSRSSEGKSRSGSGSLGSGVLGGKSKPKAKAWQAPVYAGV